VTLEKLGYVPKKVTVNIIEGETAFVEEVMERV